MTTKQVTDAPTTCRIEHIVQDLPLPGRTEAPKQLVGLADIVEQAVRRIPAEVRRETTIRMENEGAPDVIVSMGPIVQVVMNLLVHAARAVGPGRPCVVTSRIAQGEPGMARLEVIDDGADLGLATCHSIVTAHGGTLTAVSKVGMGSTFRLELPAATAA